MPHHSHRPFVGRVILGTILWISEVISDQEFPSLVRGSLLDSCRIIQFITITGREDTITWLGGLGTHWGGDMIHRK